MTAFELQTKLRENKQQFEKTLKEKDTKINQLYQELENNRYASLQSQKQYELDKNSVVFQGGKPVLPGQTESQIKRDEKDKRALEELEKYKTRVRQMEVELDEEKGYATNLKKEVEELKQYATPLKEPRNSLGHGGSQIDGIIMDTGLFQTATESSFMNDDSILSMKDSQFFGQSQIKKSYEQKLVQTEAKSEQEKQSQTPVIELGDKEIQTTKLEEEEEEDKVLQFQINNPIETERRPFSKLQ